MEAGESQELDTMMMETGDSQDADVAAMETGECSGTACFPGRPWAKLVPSNLNHSDVENLEIMMNEMVICSKMLSSSSNKHEWCKITRRQDMCSATLQNLSSRPVTVDGVVIKKEETIVIKCDDEIVSGPDTEGSLRYRFEVLPSSDNDKIQLKIPLDIEHAKCSICLNVWHDVVSVAPCLHNFCNGCFSEWLKRSQKKGSTVLCPQCRATVHFVGRNHFLHNIEQGILASDISLRRSSEEVAILDRCAAIKSNLVIKAGRSPHLRISLSPSNDESDGVELLCPQCGTGFGGFRCNRTTVHLQCHSCGGMMPSRTDMSVPQHCLGCDRSFCGSYWRALGVAAIDSHSFCSHENFKPILEHRITRIPFLTHQNNQYEQDITERCIRSMGRTLQDVISEWIVKLDNREIDRTILPLNHAEMITSGTHVCREFLNHEFDFYNGFLSFDYDANAGIEEIASYLECYDKLISFLLYWFRVTIPHYRLPPEASRREDCWYGYTCRTQHHNEEHARKRNHVCRPTRGSDA